MLEYQGLGLRNRLFCFHEEPKENSIVSGSCLLGPRPYKSDLGMEKVDAFFLCRLGRLTLYHLLRLLLS